MAHRVEAQRVQNITPNIKEAKKFDTVRQSTEKCDNEAPRIQTGGKLQVLWYRTHAKKVPCIS